MALPISHLPAQQKSLPSNAKRRGGQPRNSNALKTGLHSLHHPSSLRQISLQINVLNDSVRTGALPLSQILKQSERVIHQLHKIESKAKAIDQTLALADLLIKTSKMRAHAYQSLIPLKQKERALASISHDPFDYFERHYKEQGISRDADSFFPVSKLSARNSPNSLLQMSSSIWGSRSIPKHSEGTVGSGAVLPPSPAVRRGVGGEVKNETNYATDLTDEQWAVLAPLIPPDPHLEYLSGYPPVIIAANRLCFTRYLPTGDLNDYRIYQEYYDAYSPFPGLHSSPPTPTAKKRGRPREQIHPRLLLNAIFWKLATGQNWDDLPLDFPPMRLCRKYYTRLFRSGRWYTLILALYNHLRLEENIDTYELFEQGVFTTTPSQAIALQTGTPPTNNNYMGLLFMQLAREAYSYLNRLQKEKNPFHQVLPVFKGTAKLSNAALPFQERIPTFEPLESSRAAKKFRKAERNQKTISRIVAHRLITQTESRGKK